MPSELTSPGPRTLAAVALGISMFAGCTRGEPPVFDAGARAIALTPPSSPSSATVDAAVLAASPADASTEIVVDAGALPQTRDRPKAEGAAFDARVAALWEGIVKDDPERALPFFFPLAAYAQVKDVGHPARDWRFRLVAAYANDIHELHTAIGKNATFVSFDVPDPRARWVEPGEEYNKLGYWRVYGSKLRWDTASGTHRSADVKSLISWRGEWFIVHLSAIK